jgi:hypothetical protein
MVNNTDVSEFVTDFGTVRRVNSFQVGDWISRQNGDLNFDGAVDLKDAHILDAGLVSAGISAGLDFNLLQGAQVPEPAIVTQVLGILLLMVGSRWTTTSRRR